MAQHRQTVSTTDSLKSVNLYRLCSELLRKRLKTIFSIYTCTISELFVSLGLQNFIYFYRALIIIKTRKL